VESLTPIFAGEEAHAWMKGRLSSVQVIAGLDIKLDRRFRDDFLHRRLLTDCARMRVNVPLFELLREVKTSASIVVATDNMDCFADTFRRIRKTGRPAGRRSAATLAQWAFVCDDMICSSDVAAFKSEDPVTFFGPWLSRHGMTFHDALLIDDREDNCAAFRQQGGTALHWRMGADDIAEAATALSRWLAEPAASERA
jgi:FMN phosphatase YigB (HAD superfamily)